MSKAKEFMVDMVESGAWKYAAILLVMIIISVVVGIRNFNECREFGFSLFYCLSK